jgi:hypothetical protein
MDGFAGQQTVFAFDVGIGIDGNSGDAEGLASMDNADGNFGAVGDEDFVK